MNEMLKPEMMRDMLPRENPKNDAEEKAPESGVRRSAEPRKQVDARAEDAAKTEAQRGVEKAFFERGEAMNAAHMAGETLPKNTPEMQAEKNDRARIDRENRMELEEKIERARAGLEKAAEYLRSKHGISDPNEALSERAKGGSWGKIKGFFSRLGNAELQAKNQALDTYDKMGKSLSEMEAVVNELRNRESNPAQVQQSKRISAERGPTGQR